MIKTKNKNKIKDNKGQKPGIPGLPGIQGYYDTGIIRNQGYQRYQG